MMRWLNMLDGWLDTFDFTSTFQIVVIVLVLFKIYTLQVGEKLDTLVERTPSGYGWLRRTSSVAESIAWLWLLLYQYEANLSPRPPVAFLAFASLASVLARLLIFHLDYCRALKLGKQVATIADILPSIRRSSRGEPQQ